MMALQAEIQKPITAFYGIEILQVNDPGDDAFYMAQIVNYDGASWIKGLGPTPTEALYDWCEIIAEWGFDGEHRDYPPSIRQRLVWWAKNKWDRIVAYFERD